MASVTKNIAGQIIKLTRGLPAKVATLTSAGDVAAFTIPEPTYYNSGFMVIQVQSGGTLGPGTFALEFSIDGGNSWAVFPTATTVNVEVVYGLTGQPGSDPAAFFAAQYQIGGFGSGALFRFGFVTGPTSGNFPVWVLVG
jgi:hypothetical protein